MYHDAFSHCKKMLEYVDRTLYYSGHCKKFKRRCAMIPLITVKRGWNMLIGRCTMQVTVKLTLIMFICRCSLMPLVPVRRGKILLINA